MAEHSIWAASPPAGSLSLYTDGSPYIEVANAFYLFGDPAATAGWTVAGGRVYVTQAMVNAGVDSITITARLGGSAGSGTLQAALDAMNAAPFRSETVPVTGPGWVEARWTPFTSTIPERVIIGYKVATSGFEAYYQHATTPEDSIAAQDGSNFALASTLEHRAFFKIGTSSAGVAVDAYYGTDVIFNDTLVSYNGKIAVENSNAGSPSTEWAIQDVGDTNNLGFARPFSVNVGEQIKFACHGDGVVLDIYRIGWYGGDGWRKIASLTNVATTQPDPVTIANSNGATECTNWADTATWNVPTSVISGLFVGVLRNLAQNNASWIPFVVTDHARETEVIYKTSDSTWALAYNYYGGPTVGWNLGKSLYGANGPLGDATERAHAASYERPIVTRAGVAQTYWLACEAPMIRWMERNGIEVKYVSCRDVDIDASQALGGANIIVSSGHDEYWSQNMRDGHIAARTAGAHLIFASANEVFWRTRFDNDRRVMWCYKDTMPGPGAHVAGTALDPVTWTGTWRDTRPANDATRAPENELTGTYFLMNGVIEFDATLLGTAPYASHPFWRNTTLAGGSDLTLNSFIGFEADEIRSTRPNAVTLASSVQNIDGRYADANGEVYTGNGSLNPWGIVSQGWDEGAVSIGFGTCQWSWLLDATHDRGTDVSNLAAKQATLNLFIDLGITLFETLENGLVSSAPQDLSNYGGQEVTPPTPVLYGLFGVVSGKFQDNPA